MIKDIMESWTNLSMTLTMHDDIVGDDDDVL